MTTPKAVRVEGPCPVHWWGMVALILFGCRHHTWFPTGWGPHCARCLAKLDPEDCDMTTPKKG